MFLFKNINKPLKQSYCCLRQELCRKRNLISENNNFYSESKEYSSNVVEELVQYEDKLLFNSVIESKRMKYGYKQNSKYMTKQLRYEERVSTALKTIQPIPLSLKYFKNNISELDEAEDTAKNEVTIVKQAYEPSTNFPYCENTHVVQTDNNTKNTTLSIESKVLERKKLLDQDVKNWMTSYDNYEYDLIKHNNRTVIKDLDDWKINYGSPDPNCKISNYPCGGCGAYLHCKDTAIPGYIPSEIFRNCFSPGGADLGTILCQRCHFLKEYDIALQVRVSSDDYPKVLQTISVKSACVVLMVDLSDFPCSIWPGIADILGPKTPIIVAGNKVDLLPRDTDKCLKRVREVLYNNLQLSGFAGANIRHIELISAKTGYGVENLISSMHRIWKHRSDVYLIGCTNVGKSSLFNALLQSDFCKIQAADLIQKATTSRWPGTTLNLLKFPITNFSGYRRYLRECRLKQLQKVEVQERKLREEALKKHNTEKYATLIGHIGRSLDNHTQEPKSADSFAMQGYSNLSGKSRMGIDDRHPDYALGKWCYDTPGVVNSEQILHILTTEELVMTLPKQIIRPETFCVKPGTSLFIAGLARLDYVEGPNSIRLTVFRANDLPITLCKLNEADALYKELLGSELFGVPINKGDRLTKWPGLDLTKSFNILGKSWKESSYDVVLSSAGWIAINCGLYDYKFQAWTPEKRGVYIRDCLLPKAVMLRGARIRHSVAYKKNKFM